MISTIGPLVQGARGQWWRSTALHVLGSVAGGAATFGVLAAVGQFTLTGFQPIAHWGLAGAIILALALRELGMLGFALPRTYRSVPQAWWRTLGPSRAALVYGLVLGLGVTTVIPFGTFYAVAVWALVIANPLYGLALGSIYGFARAVPVLLASWALVTRGDRMRPHAGMLEIVAGIDSRRRAAHAVNGAAAAGFAGAVLAMVVLSLWM